MEEDCLSFLKDLSHVDGFEELRVKNEYFLCRLTIHALGFCLSVLAKQNNEILMCF